MEIKRVILNGIEPFETLEIPLAPTEQKPSKVTAFVGSNGTGKTSVLQALATSLSWFTARLRTEKSSGYQLSEEFIFNTANTCPIQIEISDSLWSSAHPNGSATGKVFQRNLCGAEPIAHPRNSTEISSIGHRIDQTQLRKSSQT
jgi:recombinational DNA repair ATPase RecF